MGVRRSTLALRCMPSRSPSQQVVARRRRAPSKHPAQPAQHALGSLTVVRQLAAAAAAASLQPLVVIEAIGAAWPEVAVGKQLLPQQLELVCRSGQRSEGSG